MAATISRHGRPWACLYAAFSLTLAASANLFAQQNAPGNEAEPGEAEKDTSQGVDTSEENFRTRMELRDQRFRQQPRADMTYSSPGGESKLDQLPQASREHIKAQMRDMIMASRQWKPGEDLSDYPYEPSTAAQTDAKLRSLEREAWTEQLQKYQQREAAAYAAAQGGKDGEQGDQEGGNGTAGAGGANDSAGGTDAQAASKSRADSAHDAAPYTGREREMEGVSTAGVSESALSFLQGKGGQMAAAGPPGQAAAGGKADDSGADDSGSARQSPDAAAPPGSLALSELALLQGMSAAPGGAADDLSVAQSMAAPAASAVQQPSSDQRADDNTLAAPDEVGMPAGTLNIDDLHNMGSVPAQDIAAAAPGQNTGDAIKPVAAIPVEPGTLDINELNRLGGDG